MSNAYKTTHSLSAPISASTNLCGTIPPEVLLLSGGNKFSMPGGIGTACGIPSPQPTSTPTPLPTYGK